MAKGVVRSSIMGSPRLWHGSVVLVVLSVGACSLDLKPFVDSQPDAGGFVATPVEDAQEVPDAFVIEPDTRDSAADAADAGKRKRIFVTSMPTTSAFGGVAGGDARCQQLAMTAKLDGTFIAWLSSREGNAIARLKVDGPWFLVDGTTRVFNSKAAIPVGPEVVVDRDENGSKVEAADVWTGTSPAGMATNADCNNWAIAVGSGTKGKTDKRDGDWTAVPGADDCRDAKRLYCFEQ